MQSGPWRAWGRVNHDVVELILETVSHLGRVVRLEVDQMRGGNNTGCYITALRVMLDRVPGFDWDA